MREIIFRGKDKQSGEWAFGWYLKFPFNRWPLRDCIIPKDKAGAGEFLRIEVDPETVGQFTGLTDYFNTPVFEGDIIRSDNYQGIVRFGIHPPHISNLGGTAVGFYVEWMYGQDGLIRSDLGFWLTCRDAVIRGNIYDNPELLEVK